MPHRVINRISDSVNTNNEIDIDKIMILRKVPMKDVYINSGKRFIGI